MTTTPQVLIDVFGPGRVRPDVPLAPFTTFRIGGPADWFLEVTDAGDVVLAVRALAGTGIGLTFLGSGSNVLIGDRGIRGVVVRARTAAIASEQPSLVRADAGVSINGLVRWTVLRGLGGLEAWAGTPGTVGGAIVGNAHYAGQLIGELVASVRLVQPDGTVNNVAGTELEFGYDTSRLPRTGEVILSAAFRVEPGRDPAALRSVARASLLHRKGTQPLHLPSAGCVFQNPDPARDRLPAGLAWSAGALIDRAGLKGRAVGGARVSPVHANFIVNEGGATARDIRALVKLCRDEVRAQFGVELRDEIVYLGEFQAEAHDSES